MLILLECPGGTQQKDDRKQMPLQLKGSGGSSVENVAEKNIYDNDQNQQHRKP